MIYQSQTRNEKFIFMQMVSQHFFIGKTEDDAVSKVQHLANEITQWRARNRMPINAKMADAMIIQKSTFVGPL